MCCGVVRYAVLCADRTCGDQALPCTQAEGQDKSSLCWPGVTCRCMKAIDTQLCCGMVPACSCQVAIMLAST